MPIPMTWDARSVLTTSTSATVRQSLPFSPVSADAGIHQQKRSQLDRLYQRVVDDLDALVGAWAPKRRDTGPKREQNLHHGRYNGPNSKSDTHLDGRWPLSFIRFNSMRD